MSTRLVAFALTFLAWSGLARAQDGADPRASLRHAVFAKLDLTDGEKQQLRQLHQQREAAEQALRQQLTEVKHKFAQALRGDASDSDMLAIHSQLAQKREELAAYRMNGLLEVRKILTPEQRTRFADLYIQFRKDRAARAAGLE